MNRKYFLTAVLGVSMAMWGWVGYRVSAVQTGKLGTVSMRVTGLDQANKYIQWSPRVESYQFTTQHDLVIPAGQTALFLLNPPKRFSQGTVEAVASGRVNLGAEYPSGSAEPLNVAPTRTWRFSDITRFPGGHRLHIENLAGRQISVTEIIITFTP